MESEKTNSTAPAPNAVLASVASQPSGVLERGGDGALEDDALEDAAFEEGSNPLWLRDGFDDELSRASVTADVRRRTVAMMGLVVLAALWVVVRLLPDLAYARQGSALDLGDLSIDSHPLESGAFVRFRGVPAWSRALTMSDGQVLVPIAGSAHGQVWVELKSGEQAVEFFGRLEQRRVPGVPVGAYVLAHRTTPSTMWPAVAIACVAAMAALLDLLVLAYWFWPIAVRQPSFQRRAVAG